MAAPPNRFVDPWHLIEPRGAWVIVVVIACLGFLNYVLLRIYGSRGLYLTAILGGLVNSTASVAELSSTLASGDLVSLTVPVVLLTSVAMFLRNALILAIFAHQAIRTAALPLVAMSAVAGYWIYRDRTRAAQLRQRVSLALASPVSLKRVLRFALLFLVVQIVADLADRLLGGAGFQTVTVLGDLVSSASTTAASANMAMHGKVTVFRRVGARQSWPRWPALSRICRLSGARSKTGRWCGSLPSPLCFRSSWELRSFSCRPGFWRWPGGCGDLRAAASHPRRPLAHDGRGLAHRRPYREAR